MRNCYIFLCCAIAGVFSYQVVAGQSSATVFKMPASEQANYDFKVTTLNTEWLSCTENGPGNETLQMKNLATVIAATASDVVALQEVGTSASYATIDTLVSRLGSEWGGCVEPWYVSNCYQNQAIVYKKARVQFVSSSLITNGGSAYNWSSGRYPVLYKLNFIAGNSVVPVSLINIHAKAYNDASSFNRRQAASEGLKTLLDGSTFNTQKIILLGDFNDYLTGTQCSSCSPKVSPYKNFIDATSDYKGLTQNLTDPYYGSPVIDNIIISNELFDNYVVNSVTREVAATQKVSNYSTTTTDHTPVSAIFRVSISTGVSSAPDISGITIYLNSTKDYVMVKSDVAVDRLALYNLTGQCLWTADTPVEKIAVSHLSPGIYIVVLKTERGYYQQKIMKY
jgi:endonuclease/exonuclease/phosphatase family metal-dependent hydrolase